MSFLDFSLDSHPFFIVVWAAGRETPHYVCPSHTPSVQPITSVTPPLNVIALYRYLTSLALLSAAPQEAGGKGNTERIKLTCSQTPSGSSGGTPSFSCVLATTSFFHLAVLSSNGEKQTEEYSRRAQTLLKWIALGIARSLLPSEWESKAIANSSSQVQQDPASALTFASYSPPMSDSLALFWENEKRKTRAIAAEMERYGAREVLAEDSDGASSMQACLEAAQRKADNHKERPLVEAAVHTFLTRWWVPLILPTPTGLFGFALAGFFSTVVCAASTAGRADSRVVSRDAPLMLPSFACPPSIADAVHLIAAFCQEQQQRTRAAAQKSSVDTLVVVTRLDAATAFVAVDTGLTLQKTQHVFQVGLVRDTSDDDVDVKPVATRLYIPEVHYVDAEAWFSHGYPTMWCAEFMHQILKA